MNAQDIKSAVQILHENKDTSGVGEDILLVARVTLANGKFIKQSLLAGKSEAEIRTEMAIVGNTLPTIAPAIEVVKLFMADEAAERGTIVTPKPQDVVVTGAAQFIDPLPMLPASLKALRQWVRWRLEDVHGRPTKVPYQVNGAKASSTDPCTWTDYETACKAGPTDSTQGIGFVVDGGIVGVDLDGCRNPETEEITEWAERIIDALNSYTEITPSGTGVRVWVRGTIPGTDKVFKLDPACGFGSKVQIEIYTDSRYFTVTGDSFFADPCEVEECDLTEAYQLLRDTKAKYPAPKSANASTADAGESTPIELLGTFETSKYDIFTNGQIESQKPFIISNCIGRLRYESQSEADLGFATILAVHFDGDAEKIDAAMRQSQLMRPKWERTDYRENTIAKAIASAQKIKAPTYEATPVVTEVAPTQTVLQEQHPAATMTVAVEEKDIPSYNPAIECGYFKEVIDAVCNGTTIPRQFMHNVIKTFVGALVSEHLKFDNLDCNSCQYSVNIGASGTSKRTVWNRGILGIFGTLIVGQGEGNSVKIFDSVDSGAGLRDAFFDAPANAPILVVIDEAASLGNKANESKNPEIVDTIIELADSTSISRVKAQKSLKRKAGKTHSNARLALYMCAQTGEVVTQAFEGRKKQGIRERLSVEFSPPIEPGVIPPIPVQTKMHLVDSLVKLIASSNWKEPMTMTAEANEFLTGFWSNQPQEVRQKVRLWKNLLLDVYLRAFSRGEHAATLEDAQSCAEHFERDQVIRKVHFRGEISNKVGLYVERLKAQTQVMREQLNRGLPVGMVAMSKRDLQTKTHAFDDNELDFFDRALNVFGKAHLWMVSVKAANGQTYTKFIPMAHENEVWDLAAGVADFKG